jgi:dTDP-glucose 4,6-dehydratase
MKLYITGGAGFIGSNFIHYISRKYPKYKIINQDCLTYAGNLNNLNGIEEGYKFIYEDISHSVPTEYHIKMEQPDIVINFAAESHVDRSINDSYVFTKTNIIGTHVLLESCRKYGIKRFHQISTDEVMGDLPINRPDLLFTEQTPLNPSSPYSASKAATDLLVMAYHRTYGLNTTISRCSNNYGPRQFPEKLIPLTIQKCNRNEKIPVYGNGLNIRDWIHVWDHCSAIDSIIHNGKSGHIYCVGGKTELTNLEVVKKIISLMGKSEDLIEFVKDRPGHDARYAINLSKIEQELN